MRSEVPICLTHASHHVKPNDNFVLARDERVTIIFPSEKKGRLDVQGDIILKLTPKPRLVILVSTDLKTSFDSYKQNSILTVSTQNLKFHCRITNLTTNNLSDCNAVFSSVDNKTLHKDVSNLKYVTFYVLNFPESLGDGVRGRNNPKYLWKSRLNFGDQQWKVVLDKVEDYQSIMKELKEKDGFGFTYAGKIEMVTGKSFSSTELLQVVNKLYYFLSFARGINAAPYYIQGFNENGEVIWKDWSLRRCDRWTLTQDIGSVTYTPLSNCKSFTRGGACFLKMHSGRKNFQKFFIGIFMPEETRKVRELTVL